MYLIYSRLNFFRIIKHFPVPLDLDFSSIWLSPIIPFTNSSVVLRQPSVQYIIHDVPVDHNLSESNLETQEVC